MNRIDLYHKTVDILYQAYFNDTLQHHNCYACAVGNIVAANMGYKYKKAKPFIVIDAVIDLTWDGFKPYSDNRPDVHKTWVTGIRNCHINQMTDLGVEQIKSTGYTIEEAAKIETSFEKASRGNSEEDYMFNGLVAVLDTLKEIHEITDEESIVKFRKHYETKKVTV